MLAALVKLLIRDRTAVYPVLLAVGLVLAWLGSALLGPGWSDATGKPLGNDFLAFHASAHMVVDDASANPYDITALFQVQRALVPDAAAVARVPFLNPPIALLWYYPLGYLAYGPALLLWWGLSVGAWLAGHAVLARAEGGLRAWGGWRMFALSFLFPPTLLWFMYGQATAFVLLILALAYAAMAGRRDAAAGAVLGLLAFKPTLALTLAIPLILGRRYRALAMGAAVVAAQAALSFYVFPAQSAYFVRHSGELARTIVLPEYPSWGVVSVFGAWHQAIGSLVPSVADALSLITTVTVLLALAVFWWREPWEPEQPSWRLAIAGSMCVGLVLGVHLYIYDLALLLIPLWITVAVVRAKPGTNPALDAGPVLVLASVLYVLSIGGGLLAKAQQLLTSATIGVPVALQLVTPALLLVGWWLIARRHTLRPSR